MPWYQSERGYELIVRNVPRVTLVASWNDDEQTYSLGLYERGKDHPLSSATHFRASDFVQCDERFGEILYHREAITEKSGLPDKRKPGLVRLVLKLINKI